MRAVNHFSTIDQKSLPFNCGSISALGRLRFLPRWDMPDMALDGRELSSVSAGDSGRLLALRLTLSP
jgi:hypothetical protein